MYACLCRAVTERSVREVVVAGASTVSAVRATCGAGTGCGGCLPSLRRLLRECLGPVPADPGPAGAAGATGLAATGLADTGLTCTAAATLDIGHGLNLAPTCSANCAQEVGTAGEPMCVAGLVDPACIPRDDVGALAGPL